MRQSISHLFRSFTLIALSLSLIFFPSKAFAVVGDVTLTSVPPNTTVTFTNDATGEKIEAKTDERDDKGVMIILLGEKKWQAGTYTIAVREPTGRMVSQPVPLSDGPNQMDLSVILGTTAARQPSKETQKVEEKKPGFWESLIPALIPSIGVGVGGGRGREGDTRVPANPCAGR